jgi:hypothetical protein
MAKKATPRSRSQKLRPADRLATGTKQHVVELHEEDLKKVSGGFKGEGKQTKTDNVTTLQ